MSVPIMRIALATLLVISTTAAVASAVKHQPVRHPVATAPRPVAVAVSAQIKNFAFVPAVLTVAPGTTVTWTNTDEEPHTVTSTNGSFRSSALDTDDKFSFTFNRPGDYAYFCRLHPHMTGRVVVKPR